MSKSITAIVNPDLLKWARKYSGLDIDYTAEKSGLDSYKLDSWESGKEHPTIAQLRRLAKVYHFPIAVFYLPEPPQLKVARPKDRRSLPGYELSKPSPELNLEFRRVSERREIALELLYNLSTKAMRFEPTATLRRSPETVASEIREILKVTIEEQESWHEGRVAFNVWRQKIEILNVLVFQATDVPIHQMRGFSLFHDMLPVIVVNRKDAYNARSFTVLHELAHLMLKTESICDMKEEKGRLNQADQRIETFCNSVAACVLVPRNALLEDRRVEDAQSLTSFGESAIRDLSIRFSVSREVIVRRMLTLSLVNEEFYRIKRAQYQKDLAKHPVSKKGYLPPAADVLSYAGKRFVGLALENFNRGNITTSDISDYLGVKLKHLDRLQNSVFGA